MASKTSPTGGLRIGVVATRFGTTDGVSLEADKWTGMLEQLGHACFYFSGASDQRAQRSLVVPEAHFLHPEVRETFAVAFSRRDRPRSLSQALRELSEGLKAQLYKFTSGFGIEILLVENALAIPLNLPLGIAVTEFVAETGIPTIAHHHDFHWERQALLVNCVSDLLDACFPPRLPHIRHVVINSIAAAQLSYRRGISALLIPNVMNFEVPPPPLDEYAAALRRDLGIDPGSFMLLQPTRIVRRKGIQHSIELVRRMHLPARLVISHAGSDEGNSYEEYLREFTALLGADVKFAGGIISDKRGLTPEGQKVYSLSDVYPQADLITYPSELEGFGNAFLEAVYFRKPILVNDYSIFHVDIKPRGFKAIEMHGFVSADTVAEVERILESPDEARAMTEHNFQLARQYFSFAVLERQLQGLLASLTGEGPRKRL